MTSAYETRGITYSEMLSTATEIGGGRGGVSEQAALGISSVWCAVRVISETIGSLPLTMYAEEGYKRQPAKNHPLRRLFKSPNPEMTQPVFFETCQSHALLWGTSFVEVERDGSGRPVHLWPVHPKNVTIVRDGETGRIAYRVTAGPVGPDQPGTQTVIDAEDMIVVPGLSPDGTVGYRLLQVARGTLGFALSAQRYGDAFFQNAARPGGALEHPGQLSDVARENLRRSWQAMHSGDQVGTMAILEEGMKFTPFIANTNEQSQYKDLLTYFVYEVARCFNVSPSKLHSLEKATWGNLETLNDDFLTTTMRPWLEKWEAELEKKLLLPSEQGRFCIEFETDSLLRADIAARYSSYTQALTSGWLSVNEVRAKEGLEEVAGGDTYASVTKPAAPETTPAPTPAAEDPATQEDVTDDRRKMSGDQNRNQPLHPGSCDSAGSVCVKVEKDGGRLPAKAASPRTRKGGSK